MFAAAALLLLQTPCEIEAAPDARAALGCPVAIADGEIQGTMVEGETATLRADENTRRSGIVTSAYGRWARCVRITATGFSRLNEPAAVIADASLGHCRDVQMEYYATRFEQWPDVESDYAAELAELRQDALAVVLRQKLAGH